MFALLLSDLVENHIEKALSRDNDSNIDRYSESEKKTEEVLEKPTLKRSASEEIVESEPKKLMLSASVNARMATRRRRRCPRRRQKLFADIAADILEDEDEEQLLQEAQATTQIIESPTSVQISAQNPLQQIIVDNNQQVLLTQPRQIIVSQPQMQQSNQMVISTGTQLKTPTGQTVIVQNTSSHQRPVMLQQANTGQFLLSQGLQGQMQLVASAQAGQYVLQTGGSQGAYMVAQPQTAVVHGQPQTVLVAQTSQQQGTAAKTIIILQQQPANSNATHHQKVVVTPQGQQVVVTQVPRPMMHTSSVTNNVIPSPTKVIKSVAGSTMTQTTSTNGVTEKKPEDVKKVKIVRDLSTPFVCEWGDCIVETKFKSANEVYLHVCASHCPTGSEEIICQWDRCDNMKRKRFSLMTHLHDKHCNSEAMKQGLVRRKQAAQCTKVEAPPQQASNPHPGYAPDAPCMLSRGTPSSSSIRRNCKFRYVCYTRVKLRLTILLSRNGTVYYCAYASPGALSGVVSGVRMHGQEIDAYLKSPKPCTTGASVATPRAGPPSSSDQVRCQLSDDNEGPVTKSISLTASLILRNLVIYSSHCKRYLKSYESHLANVALSNVESSRTIAQVLYDMNDGSTHR
ncbi:hypothetical protein NQ318_013409 [Aromia moschata]|uniref:Uncharacterized protein n=1 Tax=Aromia moschata TaxID=1265417 RepID=A0AAV8YR30_9CUCU|nr:hypothetical protein NQ318_013409 [Aromia moschata]